jgi:hypothetical protein
MTKLDWERSRREEIVARQGAERAESPRVARAVYASDAVISRLQDCGYSGKRPETAAMAQHILRLLRPLGVTHTQIEKAASLVGQGRIDALAELAIRLDSNYEVQWRRVPKDSDKGRDRSRLDKAYKLLARRIRNLEKSVPR